MIVPSLIFIGVIIISVLFSLWWVDDNDYEDYIKELQEKADAYCEKEKENG